MDCFTIALFSQSAFVVWFSISHFIPLPPLNDLTKEAFPGEHKVNFFLLCLWALGVYGFYTRVPWQMWLAAITCWSVTMFGHIMSWWIPYFFGWPTVFLKDAAEDNERLPFPTSPRQPPHSQI